MNKLKCKHLAPYLIYDLKLQRVNYKHEKFKTLTAYDLCPDGEIDNIKPILHPLSDIAKVFEVMEEDDKKVIMNCEHILKKDFVFWQEPYFIVQILFKYHFDVFGLIENGLAIDINSIKIN